MPVLLLVASCIDLRTHRIPNFITFPLILSGLIYQIHAGHGLQGPAGMIAGFTWLFIPYLFAWVGAGDVKLMAGAATWTGWPGCVPLILASGLCGAIWVLVLALRRDETRGLWLATAGGIREFGRELLKTFREASGRKVPYGATIFLGYVASLWF